MLKKLKTNKEENKKMTMLLICNCLIIPAAVCAGLAMFGVGMAFFGSNIPDENEKDLFCIIQ